jgi:hypothetical protein
VVRWPAARSTARQTAGGSGTRTTLPPLPHAQDPVAVLLAQVVDVRADRLEDPQSKQAQQAHEREVKGVGRLSGGGEHRLELQVRQPEGRGLRRDARSADVVGRRVRKDAVDDAGPVEARDDGQPAGHCGGLKAPHVLQPP